MKTKIPLLLVLLAGAVAACKTSGGFEPIVIDLSSGKTPPPATPTPTPTPRPQPTGAVPTPASAPPVDATPAPAVALSTPARPRTNAERVLTDRESSEPPEKTLGRRMDAYNRRDLEALLTFYAPDARIYEPPDRLRDAGLEQIRRAMAARLEVTPWVRLTVGERLTQGAFVVQREFSAGAEGSPALVVYELRGVKIVNVWVLSTR